MRHMSDINLNSCPDLVRELYPCFSISSEGRVLRFMRHMVNINLNFGLHCGHGLSLRVRGIDGTGERHKLRFLSLGASA